MPVNAGLLHRPSAVKMPVVPLHGWLPDAHVSGSRPPVPLTSRDFAETAAYGLLRFLRWRLRTRRRVRANCYVAGGPSASSDGAWMAFAQTDLKRRHRHNTWFPTASC
ncbi:proton-conducting transporter membrane subunit [Escherichia coli]